MNGTKPKNQIKSNGQSPIAPISHFFCVGLFVFVTVGQHHMHRQTHAGVETVLQNRPLQPSDEECPLHVYPSYHYWETNSGALWNFGWKNAPGSELQFWRSRYLNDCILGLLLLLLWFYRRASSCVALLVYSLMCLICISIRGSFYHFNPRAAGGGRMRASFET